MARLDYGEINLERNDLAEFLPNLRSVKAFEGLARAVTSVQVVVNQNTNEAEATSATNRAAIDVNTAAIAAQGIRITTTEAAAAAAGASVAAVAVEQLAQATVLSVSISTAMADGTRTYVAAVSGITLTLPSATPARVGKVWSVFLLVVGTATVAASGADVIVTATSPNATSVPLTARGALVRLRCIASGIWSAA